jgi:hypothetical protein
MTASFVRRRPVLVYLSPTQASRLWEARLVLYSHHKPYLSLFTPSAPPNRVDLIPPALAIGTPGRRSGVAHFVREVHDDGRTYHNTASQTRSPVLPLLLPSAPSNRIHLSLP